MSDEEKKAIEHFKNYPTNWEFTYEVDKMAIDIILKLIEKQSKEIEELNKKIQRIYDTQRMIDISDINKSHISFN